jgi:hypothetical protein
MVLALKRDEARVGNAACQHQPVLEGDARVASSVQHQGWDPDTLQQIADIDIADNAQHTNGGLGGGGDAFQVVQPAHLLERGVRHDQRSEHLPGGRVVLPPAFADQHDRGFIPRDIGGTASLAPSLREGTAQDETRYALGMPDGIGD